MTVNFSHNNKPIRLSPGLPGDYDGNKIRGADSCHTKTAFGWIILQEVSTALACFRILHLHYETPAAIICHYDYSRPVVCVRTAWDQAAYEFIKGAGSRHFEKKQYSWLSGKSWQSLLRPHEPGHYTFLDIVWKPDFFSDPLKVQSEDLFLTENIRDRIPEILSGPRRYLSADMYSTLLLLRAYDYSAATRDSYLHEQLETYLKLLIADDKTYTWKRLNIGQSDWEAAHRAAELILADPYIHYTIPQLSRKAGINEYKLKKIFPRITGFTIDDYRKNLALGKTRDMLERTGVSIKTIYPRSGYSSFSAYSSGFKKMFHCSPGEIRSDEWDIGHLLK